MQHNFLISDFSGEDYSSAIANVTLMKEEFGVLKRADVIVMIIDGERLSQRKTRNSTIFQTEQLLRTMNDANIFSKSVTLEIVISKYDIIRNRIKSEPDIVEVLDKICYKLSSNLDKIPDATMRFFKVSAMPVNPKDCKVGLGLAELLHSWTEKRTMEATETVQLNFNSEFNKFHMKMKGAAI